MKYVFFIHLLAITFQGLSFQDTVNYSGVDSTQHVYASDLINEDFLDHRFLEKFYHHYTLEHFIENHYDMAYYETETIGDFSRVDPYTFSFTGYSYQWNKYYQQGHRINSLTFPGSSLYKPYLVDRNVTFDMVDASVQFNQQNTQDRVIAQWNHGTFGGRFPGTDEIIKFILGHNSAFKGVYVPITQRKKTRDNGMIYFSKKINDLPQSFYLNVGARKHVGFNYGGIDKTWDEGHVQFHAQGELPNFSGQFFDNIYYAAGVVQRDNLFSEFYYDVSETSKFNQLSFSISGSKRRGNSLINSGINLSKYKIRHQDLRFARNIIDQDGEGMEPWYPDANITELTLHHLQEIPLSQPGLSIRGELYNGLIRQNAMQTGYFNRVYFQDTIGVVTSLYGIEWDSESFATGLLENAVGLTYSRDLHPKLNLSSSVDLTFDALLLDRKSVSSLNYQADATLVYLPGKKSRFKLQLGRRRVPFHFDQAKFLSDHYLSGQYYFWDDANSNLQIEGSELGAPFITTGGKYHNRSTNLKQPSINYLDLSWDYYLGNGWSFYAIGQYRSFRNLWTVEFNQPVNTLGNFTTIGNRDVFFFNGGQDVYYDVVPFKSELMELGAQKDLSFLFDNPFYGGTTLKLIKESERLFYATSFSAYMVVGFGPIGNGVTHNTPGILSETLANPNTYFNFLGRHDSDRAFIIRSLVGYQFTEKFHFVFSLLWKDGQPFNLMETSVQRTGNQSQVAIWNQDIKGINPFTGQFGTRESAYFNLEIRARYDFNINGSPLSLGLDFYNLFDFATTLSNYTFSPTELPQERFVLDVQIPRGFIITLDYKF